MANDRPLRIALVGCSRNAQRFREDASFIYRCDNLAAALRDLGHRVVLTHLNRLNPLAPLDAVMFHRPRYTFVFRAAVSLLRRRDVLLMADVDDLIFDEALAHFSPGVLNGLVPLADTQAQYASHRRALAAFEAISVSTAPLAEEARRCFPGARILRLPNAVHHHWRQVEEHDGVPPARPRLTYFPGTRSHDRDFATIADPLSRALARHPHLELHVTGPLRFELHARPGQVQHHAKVPFHELHPRVRAGMVNLAPLEATPFTRCKSALKVMEAGYWGIPTISAPLPDAERFENAGAIVPACPERWSEEIERLVTDEVYYGRLTQGLRARVLEHADVYDVAKTLLRFVACERR